MSNSAHWIVALAALVVGVAIGAMITGIAQPERFGGVTNEDETFKYDVTVEGTVTSADVTSTDDITVGDDLNVTEDIILTDNDFCIQFYATSTATTIKMVASTTVASGSNIGLMTMQYGTCVE